MSATTEAVKALAKHSANQELQLPKREGNKRRRFSFMARQALQERASNIPVAAQEDFLHIVRVGGVPAILQTLRSEMEYGWIVELSCRTLRNIVQFHQDQFADVPASQAPASPVSQVSQNNGFHLLAQLLTLHESNNVVVESVCALLALLARVDKGNAATIAAVGTASSVMRVMRAHGGTLSVQVEAMALLQALSVDGDNKVLIPALGLVPVIIQTMQRFPLSVELQREACGTLCNLAVVDKNEELIVRHRGVEAVLFVMEHHRDDAEVQWHSCGALHNLALTPANMERIGDLGGIRALALAVSTHLDNEEVLIEACEALYYLTRHNPNKVRAHHNGVTALMEEVLMRYRSKNHYHLLGWARKLHKVLTSKRVVGKQGLVARQELGHEHFALRDFLAFVSEIAFYLTFLTLFLMSSVLNRNGSRVYRFTDALKASVLDRGFGADFLPNGEKTFADITTVEDAWAFLEGPLVDGVFQDYWYNGEPFATQTDSPRGFALHHNRVLGGVRLRQVRVANGSCEVADDWKGPAYDSIFGEDEAGETVWVDVASGDVVDEAYVFGPRSSSRYANSSGVNYCYGEYSFDDDSEETFLGAASGHPYRWVGSNETNMLPYWGQLGWYKGSGFVHDLPLASGGTAASCNASCALARLKEDRWIDLSTRAVFVSFTVYNAAINYHCAVLVLLEFPATGGVVATSDYRAVRFHMYSGDEGTAQAVVDIILCAFVLWFFKTEVGDLLADPFNYVRDGWNLWDLTNISLFMAAVIVRVVAIYRIQDELDMQAAVEAGGYVNVDREAQLLNLERLLNAFNGLLMWFKVLKYLETQPRFSFLMRFLRNSWTTLSFYLVIFFIVFLAFAQASFLVFSAEVYNYRSFAHAALTLFRSAMTGMRYDELAEVDRFFGPLFFLAFQVSMLVIVLNVFIAILNSAYEHTPKVAVDPDVAAQLAAWARVKASALMRVQGFTSWVRSKAQASEMLGVIGQASAAAGGLVTREKLMEALLAAGYDEGIEADAMALFDTFDTDSSGVLERDEVDKLVDMLQRRVDADNTVEDDHFDALPPAQQELTRLVDRWNGAHDDATIDLSHPTGLRRVVRKHMDRIAFEVRRQLEEAAEEERKLEEMRGRAKVGLAASF